MSWEPTVRLRSPLPAPWTVGQGPQLPLPWELDSVPEGVMPVLPPDAPAALFCVEVVLADVVQSLGVPTPDVRWFTQARAQPGESRRRLLGFHYSGEPVIWLNVRFRTPQGLARTVAHEAVHYWQVVRRGWAQSEVERDAQETEAQRLSAHFVPKGTSRRPRGPAGDLWREPASRRHGRPATADDRQD